MKKFKHAVFCYYIIGFDAAMHQWLLLLAGLKSVRRFISKKTDRAHLAKWVTDMFKQSVDFDTVMQVLGGDAYLSQNIDDAAQIKAETGKNVIELWDTDPIFARFPHLKTMARNKEFEAWWKSQQKQK